MIELKKLENIKDRIIIVGPIYNKIEKLNKLENIVNKNDIIIYLGDICYSKNNDIKEIKDRIEIYNNFNKYKNSYYIIGNYDLNINYSFLIKEILNIYIGIKIIFYNNSSNIIIHGGISNKYKLLDSLNDIEIAFIDGTKENWHNAYNGRFGYAISSHPYTGNEIKLYSNSASLDTLCHKTDILVVQELNEFGLGKTHYI